MSTRGMRRDLEDRARQLGYACIGRTKSGHCIYRHPAVKEQVITAWSASDHRAIKNALSVMRRLLRQAEGA